MTQDHPSEGTLVKNLRFWIVSEIKFNRVGL